MLDFPELSPILAKVIELSEELQNARKSKSAFMQAGETPLRLIGRHDYEDNPAKDKLWDYLSTLDTDVINQILTIMYGGRDAITSLAPAENEYDSENESNIEAVYEVLTSSDIPEYNFLNDYEQYRYTDRDGAIITITDKFYLSEYLKAGKEAYNI